MWWAVIMLTLCSQSPIALLFLHSNSGRTTDWLQSTMELMYRGRTVILSCWYGRRTAQLLFETVGTDRSGVTYLEREYTLNRNVHNINSDNYWQLTSCRHPNLRVHGQLSDRFVLHKHLKWLKIGTNYSWIRPQYEYTKCTLSQQPSIFHFSVPANLIPTGNQLEQHFFCIP
jgi:hypothetical protein